MTLLTTQLNVSHPVQCFGHTGVHLMGSPYVPAQPPGASERAKARNRLVVDLLSLDALEDLAALYGLYKNPDVGWQRQKRQQDRRLFMMA